MFLINPQMNSIQLQPTGKEIKFKDKNNIWRKYKKLFSTREWFLPFPCFSFWESTYFEFQNKRAKKWNGRTQMREKVKNKLSFQGESER